MRGQAPGPRSIRAKRGQGVHRLAAGVGGRGSELAVAAGRHRTGRTPPDILG